VNDVPGLDRTRRTLHGAAELLLAAPQYRRTGRIGLRIIAGGLATTREPRIEIVGRELHTAGRTVALAGTFGAVAEAAQLADAGPLREVYSGGPAFALTDEIDLDDAAAATIYAAFERGDAALRRLAPDQPPILWPEHFDVGVALDGVNYGVSPGDSAIPAPYAYVGPHEPRVGDFWDVPFGSARLMSTLADEAAVLAYFEQGRERAALDPRRG